MNLKVGEIGGSIFFFCVCVFAFKDKSRKSYLRGCQEGRRWDLERREDHDNGYTLVSMLCNMHM